MKQYYCVISLLLIKVYEFMIKAFCDWHYTTICSLIYCNVCIVFMCKLVFKYLIVEWGQHNSWQLCINITTGET